MTKLNIGVITALGFETQTLNNNLDASVVEIGAGNLGSLEKAVDFLARQRCELIISWGTAGALHNDIRSGDICLPNKIVDLNGQVLSPEPFYHRQFSNRLSPQFTIHFGPLLQSSNIVTSTEEKSRLASQYDANAVDMESFSIANSAHSHNIPFLVIRCIIDELQDELPEIIKRCLNKNGQIDTTRLLLSIGVNPTLWPAFIRLSRCYRNTKTSLKRAALQLAR